MTPGNSRVSVATQAAGWVLLLIFSLGLAAQGSTAANPRLAEGLYLAGFAGYLLIVLPRLSTGGAAGRRCVWPIAAALLLRLPLLVADCSDDVYRYLWEGRVQLAGHNPFAVAPDDPRLAELRAASPYWSKINHPSYTAIYPPLAQMQCVVLAAIHPHPITFKLAALFWEMLLIAALLAWLRATDRPPDMVLIYALCPLSMVAFALEGHLDSLMLAPAVWAGVAASQRRYKTMALLLGLACSAKLVVGVLLVWLVGHRPYPALLAVGVVVLSYLPHADAGGALFNSLLRFGREGESMDALHHWFVTGASDPEARRRTTRAVALTAGLAATMLLARRRRFDQFAGPTMQLWLVLAPIVHIWYFTWVLAFLPVRMTRVWLAPMAAVGFYYEAQLVQQTSGQWLMPIWVGHVVWGSLLVAWMLGWVVRRRAGGAQTETGSGS